MVIIAVKYSSSYLDNSDYSRLPNLKSELIIDDLHKKIDLILENQKKLNKKIEALESKNKQ